GSTETALQGAEPSINASWDFRADWRYKADKYSSNIRYDFLRTNARDVSQIDRDFLDNDLHDFVFRQGYEFVPGTTIWLQPVYEAVNYRLSRDGFDVVRDNQGWTLLAGLTVNATAISFVEAGIGYMSRDFEQAGQDPYSGLAYEGRLVWNISNLVTLELAGGRTARVVESIAAPIAVDDSITFELAWDPRENLIFEAGAAYTLSEFETSTGTGRGEDLLAANLKVRYLLSPNLFFEATYTYEERDSTLLGDDFQANVYSIRAGLEL
ncbi:MAG: outer membrane beta-barrel protein, partial [Alphaproteobacteria bacterium]|nr:outer membrane beta-barrel protein [Alphaproteobacteria bacterium]